MARLAFGISIGIALAVVGMAALGLHAAQTQDDDTLAAAQEAGVDPTDLQGAMLTTGLPAREYLYATGELRRPAPPPVQPIYGSAALEARLACAAFHESHNDPSATNYKSGAAGKYQFLSSTWLTTPQGKAGLSPYDPVAAHAAAVWIAQRDGFETHWAADLRYGC